MLARRRVVVVRARDRGRGRRLGLRLQAVLAGGERRRQRVSPYPDPATLARAGTTSTPTASGRVFRFPYPAPAAVALAPLALLGFHTAAAIWSALLDRVAPRLALDPRRPRLARARRGGHLRARLCRASASGPSRRFSSCSSRIAWRWRDRPWVSGGLVALAISFKLFLWPLVVWLAATRRFAAACAAAALAAAITLGAWAAIGFDGLADYPELARKLAEIVRDARAVARRARRPSRPVPDPPRQRSRGLVGLSLLACVVALARRGEDERTTFSVALVASLALTPIVWLHYFALLIVPLALARPRLSWPWALLWIFWLIPAGRTPRRRGEDPARDRARGSRSRSRSTRSTDEES